MLYCAAHALRAVYRLGKRHMPTLLPMRHGEVLLFCLSTSVLLSRRVGDFKVPLIACIVPSLYVLFSLLMLLRYSTQ